MIKYSNLLILLSIIILLGIINNQKTIEEQKLIKEDFGFFRCKRNYCLNNRRYCVPVTKGMSKNFDGTCNMCTDKNYCNFGYFCVRIPNNYTRDDKTGKCTLCSDNTCYDTNINKCRPYGKFEIPKINNYCSSMCGDPTMCLNDSNQCVPIPDFYTKNTANNKCEICNGCIDRNNQCIYSRTFVADSSGFCDYDCDDKMNCKDLRGVCIRRGKNVGKDLNGFCIEPKFCSELDLCIYKEDNDCVTTNDYRRRGSDGICVFGCLKGYCRENEMCRPLRENEYADKEGFCKQLDVCNYNENISFGSLISCDAYFNDWFFNPSLGDCVQVGYSGCSSLGYSTKDECLRGCNQQTQCSKFQCLDENNRCINLGGNIVRDDNGNCLDLLSVDLCELKSPDSYGRGIVCEAYWQTWFFNPVTNKCELSGYSGCQSYGFNTENECLKRCNFSVSVCYIDDCIDRDTNECRKPGKGEYKSSKGYCMPLDTKCNLIIEPSDELITCFAFWQSYFYDKSSNTCVLRSYSGCSAAENSFESKEVCENFCLVEDNCDEYNKCFDSGNVCREKKSNEIKGDKNECIIVDKCKYSKKLNLSSASFCKMLIKDYFYNIDTGKCELVSYSGCNNLGFDSLEKCNKICTFTSEECYMKDYCIDKRGVCRRTLSNEIKDINNKCVKKSDNKCLPYSKVELPKGMVTCMAYWETFFYNPKTGTCEKKGYSGCSPSGFETMSECIKSCGLNEM